MPDTPLRPDELPTYKTPVETESEAPDTGKPTPGQDARPWVVIGLALLGLFVVLMILAIAMALR